ncbi:MAG: TIGR04086 family membrane protein [Acetatifactor sp.]
MEQTKGQGGLPIAFLLKSLLFSYILTGILLALLACLLYKAGLDEKAVSAAIIVIYVGATFFAGFMAGKKLQNRRFLWGLMEGCAYFVILVILSLLAGGDGGGMGHSFLTTFVLCGAGGMLGGMLS